MGVSSSKHPQHHPRPLHVNPYGRPIGPVGAPNFGPPYPFPNPQFQQGFNPNYGYPPPPSIPWYTQNKPQKRRKTRKTKDAKDDRDARRHKAQDQHMTMPVGASRTPVIPTPTPRPAGARASPSAPSPAPGRGSIRRTQTPFRHARTVDSDEDDSDDDSSPAPIQPDRPRSSARVRSPIYTTPHNQAPHRTPSRGQPQPLYQPQQPEAALRDPDITRALQPLEPPHPSAFGPSEPRPYAPLSNPLPSPPRDLYETSPYKSLLTLPQTTALLTANFAPKPPAKDVKKPRKGLFRAFSSRKHEKEPGEEPKVHFVPIFVNNPSTGSNAMPPMPALPQLPKAGPSAPSIRTGHSANHSKAIRYNEDSDYWSFMNHSPHRIFFDDKEWPTATHLVEARKYLPGHPAVAEEIRLCGDVGHVYPISANYQQFQDPHWSEKHMQILEEVLYLKFSQHANLRNQLWDTEDIPLIYDDHNDPYWGVGPMGDGANVHGQLMEKVRARLLEGRIPPKSSG